MTNKSTSRPPSTGRRRTGRSRSTDVVTEAIRDRILNGVYGSGEWLPAERDLTWDFGVHRRVIRAAISLLEEEGYLLRRTNCRPVVQLPAQAGASTNHVDVPPHPPEKTVALLMWKGGGVFEHHGTAQTRIMEGMHRVFERHSPSDPLVTQFYDLGGITSMADNAAREAENLRITLRHRFAGVVFYPYAYQHNQALIRSVSSRMPFVVIDRLIQRVDTDYVGVQNRQALYDATRHLIDLGHERIAFVTNAEPINTVADRLEGYLVAMVDAFGAARQEFIFVAPTLDAESWPLLDMAFRLPLNQRPSAAVCVNDHLAVHLLERLDGLGVRVPRDISVVGFDNLIHKLPNGIGLTTMAQPYEEIGEKAAEIILQRQGRPAKEYLQIELPCDLVLRNSTQPPRSA